MGPCETMVVRRERVPSESNDTTTGKKDQDVQTKLNNLKLQDPQINCPQGNRINKLCLSEKCKESPRCSQVGCKNCGKDVHPLCNTVSMNQLTQMLNDRISSSKDFIARILKEEEGALEKVKSTQEDLLERLASGSVQKSNEKAVIEIYQNKNQKGVSGKQAQLLCERLKQDKQKNSKQSNNLIKRYAKEVERAVQSFTKLKEQIYKEYISGKVQQKPKAEEQSIVRKRSSNKEFMPVSSNAKTNEPNSSIIEPSKDNPVRQSSKEQPKNIKTSFSAIKTPSSTTSIAKTSKIGTNLIQIKTKIIDAKSPEGQGQIAFLRRSLDYPKKIKLIFRASEHSFSAQAFHRHCDGIHDTLVIAKTQFGKIIGGYSYYKWNQEKNGNYVNDPSRQAFLLQFNRKEKMIAQRDNRLICCHPGCGPSFGWNDLVLADNCNAKNSSIADFPCTYNREGSPYRTDSQDSVAVFSGATSGLHFRVEEYEVFEVEFNVQE